MTEERAVSVAGQINPAEAKQRIADLQAFMRDCMVPDVDYGVVPGGRGKPCLFKPGAQKLMVAFGMAGAIKDVKRVLQPENNFIMYEVTFAVVNKATGMPEGEGIGQCSSLEKKYAKMPWPETANTILKMSKKRGQVDAVLDATGANVLFTQDLEDFPSMGESHHEDPPAHTNGAVPAERPQRPAGPAGPPRIPAPRGGGAPARGKSDVPACKNCGGPMYDNRGNKKFEKAPDFKCKDPKCLDEKGYVTGMWEEQDRGSAPREEAPPPEVDNDPFSDEGQEAPPPPRPRGQRALPKVQTALWGDFAARAEARGWNGQDGIFSEKYLLHAAVQSGFVDEAVTDANIGWLEQCCQKFFRGAAQQ